MKTWGFFLIVFFYIFSILLSQPKQMIGVNKRNKHNLRIQHLEEFVNITDEEEFGNNIFLEKKQKNISEKLDIIDFIIYTPVLTYLQKEKKIYSYNSYGKINSTLFQFWDKSSTSFIDGKWIKGKWKSYLQNTYIYDANGNRTSLLAEFWREEKWEKFRQETYTYDLSGNRTSLLQEVWREEKWKNSGQETYTYDLSGNRTSLLHEFWREEKWENSGQETYTYDLSGNRTSLLHEVWVRGVGNWRNFLRKTYVYDSNGNRTSLQSEIWNKEKKWENSQEYTFTYNLYNNTTSLLKKIWIREKWEEYGRATYTYDLKGKWTLYLYEIKTNGKWETGDGIFFYYKLFGNYYSVGGSKAEIFYKNITNINKSNHLLLNFSLSQNYPNPFNPTTNIKYSIPTESLVTITIFNILGKEVATIVNRTQSAGNYKVDFNASKLPNGIYFYRINAGSFSETKKMMLLK